MKLKIMNVLSGLTGKRQYMLRPITFPTVDIEQISSDISNATSLTKSDVQNCLHSMADFLSQRILSGNICDVGDLGIIKVTIKAKAVESGSFDMKSQLKYLHYRFTPRTDIKDALKTMSLEVTDVTNFYDGESANVVTEQ